MQNKEPISFNSILQQSHYMFPFDSARFEERFSFTSPIDIRGALLFNGVPGFYMPCDTAKVVSEPGSATITFELRRNPLIIYTAVLLLGVAASFAILITLFAQTGPLPGALASYFFALWTLRALFGLTAEGFPTLFDIGIVVLVLLIPVLLLLRVLGLPGALRPISRYGRNLARRLEGREPVSSNADA